MKLGWQPDIYCRCQVILPVCQADKSPLGVRDAALIWILRCGLRRAEVVDLKKERF